MKNKKLIPEIRFPEFSGKWMEKNLGEIGKIVGGGTPDTNNQKFWNASIIWLTPTEILNKKYVKNSIRRISELGLKNSSAKLLPKEAILITTRATIGEIAITKKECSTNQGFQSLIINKNYSNEFIYYLLNRKNIKNEMIKKANGTTFLEINKTSLSKIKIHLPPTLNEQNKIADFLSSVDEKIEIISKKIEELKKQKKGMLQKLLNVKCNNGKCEPDLRFKGFSEEWSEKKLGEIGKIYQPKTISEKEFKKMGYPVYGANGLIGHYDKFNHEQWQVIITCRGSTCGTVNKTQDKCWITANSMVINIDKNSYFFKLFLFYLFQVQNFRKIVEGSGQPQITQKSLQSFKTHLPPTLAEQEQIASFFSLIDEKIEVNEEKLEKLKVYKKGLLQKMFV